MNTNTVNRQKLLEKIPELSLYRLATKSDVRPGNELFMAKIHTNLQADSPRSVRVVKVDLDYSPDKQFVVYQDQINAKRTQHLFPLSYLVDVTVEEVESAPYRTILYLVPAAK